MRRIGILVVVLLALMPQMAQASFWDWARDIDTAGPFWGLAVTRTEQDYATTPTAFCEQIDDQGSYTEEELRLSLGGLNYIEIATLHKTCNDGSLRRWWIIDYSVGGGRVFDWAQGPLQGGGGDIHQFVAYVLPDGSWNLYIDNPGAVLRTYTGWFASPQINVGLENRAICTAIPNNDHHNLLKATTWPHNWQTWGYGSSDIAGSPPIHGSWFGTDGSLWHTSRDVGC